MSNKFTFYPISARLFLLSLSLLLLSKRLVSATNSFTLIQTNSSNKTKDVGDVPSIPQKHLNLNSSIERIERHLGIFQASFKAFEEQEFLRSTLKTFSSTSLNEEDKGTLSSSIASITIQFKNVNNSGARMDISYTIENGPTNCKDCLVAIHKAKTCSSQKISRRTFLKSKNVNNPWRKKAGTTIVTDENGRGQGIIEDIDNGYDIDKNANRVFILYDGYKLRHRDKNKRAKVIMCGVLRKVTNAS